MVAVEKAIHFLPGVSVRQVLILQVEWGLALVPVPQNFVHVLLGSDPEKLLFLSLLILLLFVTAVLLLAGPLAVETVHLSADALEVLLDAHLGEALGVLRAGLVEQLALDVDVVGPVFGLQESGLCEARSHRPHHEGQCGH